MCLSSQVRAEDSRVDATLTASQGVAADTISSPAFSTHFRDEMVFVSIKAEAAGSAHKADVVSVAGAGLTWTRMKAREDSSAVEIWRAFAPSALHEVTVTATFAEPVVSSLAVASFSGSQKDEAAPQGVMAPTVAIPSAAPQMVETSLGLARSSQSDAASESSSSSQSTQSSSSAGAVTGTSGSCSSAGCVQTAGTTAISTNLSTLNFGSVNTGAKKTLTLTLGNTGQSSVTISKAAFSNSVFSLVSSALPISIATGQSATVQVQFAPTQASAVTGTLTLTTSSHKSSQIQIALTGTGTTSASNPQLTLSTTSVAFGSVQVGTAKSASITLKSTGTSSLTVSSAVMTGSGFSVIGGSFPQTIAPGSSYTVQLQFAPTTATKDAAYLTITSNSSNGTKAQVNLSGTGTASAAPQLTLSTSSLAFGSVQDGTKKSSLVTLTSTGTSSLTISSATISGTGFSVIAGSFPQTLAPGASYTVQVQFAPTTAVAATGTLTFSSNSSSGTTAKVALSGTGTTAASPQLKVSTTALSFGTVNMGSSSTLSVTLTSSGTSSVTVSGATVSGAGFSLASGTLPVTLAPGSTATLGVTFDPTASGADSGTLLISSNSTTGTTTSVALSGTGGSSTSHSVTLSWSAPSSSAVPVAGYHVYRETSTSGSFSLLNSAMSTSTSYVDSTVVAGTTYVYEVKSVDAEGVESAASNQLTTTIP